jgi:hypothetical protein
LDDIARQQRERKAVKSDDAAVPEYLWTDHLAAGSSVTEWDAKAMDDLRRVSSWLRERMLCWWKRKVVSLYVTWMKEKYSLLALSFKGGPRRNELNDIESLNPNHWTGKRPDVI